MIGLKKNFGQKICFGPKYLGQKDLGPKYFCLKKMQG